MAINPTALALFRTLIGRPNAVGKGGRNNDGNFNDWPVLHGQIFPRNSLNGQRFFQVDLRVMKRFVLREQHRALIHVNLFNLFNQVNKAIGSTSLNSAVYGILSRLAGGPFGMQLGFRYEF